MKEFNVYEEVDEAELKKLGYERVQSMWRDDWKDESQGLCRSKLVAMQFNRGMELDGTFAATPTTKGSRMMLSRAAT